MQGQTEDRWRELAELLGVPDAGAPTAREPIPGALPPEPFPPPTPYVPHLAPVEEEELPPLPAEPLSAPATPVEAEMGWEEEFDEDDTPLDENEPIAAAGVSAVEEPGRALAEGEEKPRRGRRRRRRGKRRGDADHPEVPGAQPAPADDAPRERPPVQQRDDQQRGRGRGQRGRRDDEPRQRRDEPPERESTRPKAPADEPPIKPGVLAEDTDFSDWTVPSWQDLIASLYRPER
ncbi:MAG: hypothetical protein HYX68_00230 [Planctomycetes bacterium]|nr:hypothetical protein [Planctomycetota bacterium]